MKIIVFGKTFDRASEQLDKLLEDIPDIFVLNKRKSQSNTMHEVIMIDDTRYIAIRASDYARGYKCDIVYVDMDIDIDIVQNVILHTLSASKIPEGLRMQYY